ncbi:hypothetical protein DCS32_10965 [Dokdonia sp. Dokd-P16]|uniref:hypothetical protein n=1 Tax=Dokdonia sp. Dokd-P16 TaxID=2173169 RepID=UPI000D549F08|nr:hypothetical protein [Dokdonia sp. Dokd-P16]AWH74657.1 hypothetical protein DCS32_10965 [Dokdonia sp. Dokd-P16]
MYRFIVSLIFIAVLLLLGSCGVSNANAKKGFDTYLNTRHPNKYDILTFKRNFNTATMNPNLYWVELSLKENPEIVINFRWDAENNDVYVPDFYEEDRGIEALTHYQQQEIVLREEIHQVLEDEVVAMEVNVFNHTISITLDKDPTFDDFQFFSRKICSVVDKYPDTWTSEARVDFRLKGERKGFYELIVKPNNYDDSRESYRYHPNAIIINNYGSTKADAIDHVVQGKFSKPNAPVYLNRIWVHQADLSSMYLAIEKHKPRQDPYNKKMLTEGAGMYLVKMDYNNLDMKIMSYYDYKTISRDNIFLDLMEQLPEDYKYLIEDS